ncbi:MAG TPA: hypothetical protein DIW50_17120 [Prolixibacteraceae bacterium]|nr:hypothetical protein [Prolixibacteraceae bacterium]
MTKFPFSEIQPEKISGFGTKNVQNFRFLCVMFFLSFYPANSPVLKFQKFAYTFVPILRNGVSRSKSRG